MSFIRALFCVALPPLVVYDCGLGAILVTLVLTLLGWIPGIIAATLFVITRSTYEKSRS